MKKPINVTDETNICLKCKWGKQGGTPAVNINGENVTRCRCNYNDTPGKSAGYRRSSKNYLEK